MKRMNITSTLALNGLKRNEKRTIGSLIAIALSTALITANLSFASSGIAMLKSCLGDDLGDYAGAYNVMIMIPAFLLTLLIVFMSVTVISNIFRASANDRIKELGVLKCVGGTSKQIRKTVLSEGLWLSIIGIPAGLILGTLFGFIGVKAAGIYVDRIVEISKAIAMRSLDLKLSFTVSLSAYVIAAIVALLTVIASALRPARQMGRITAIECVRFGYDKKENIEDQKHKADSLGRLIWGFEGELGARNISRNRQAFKSAIRALATGICLLLATAGVSAQLGGIRQFMKSDKNMLVIDYVSLRDEGSDPATGRRSDVILHPINAETYEEINNRLNAFGGFEVYGIGSNRDTYTVTADSFSFTDEMKKVSGVIDEYGEMDIDLISMSDNIYRKMCEASGTEYGGTILINEYKYNDFGTEKIIVPFLEPETTVTDTSADPDGGSNSLTLVRPNGETSELKIDGVLYREDTNEWFFDNPNVATVQVIVPGAEARFFDWYCEPGDSEEEFVKYAGKVLEEYYPLGSEDSYADQGYTVRISREDNMVMALNVMIILGEIIMYGFVTLLALIGFAGFISTITANLRMRSREFAVLKSVGMTNPALRKMVYSESMLCTIKASVKGVIAGNLIPLLINLPLRTAFPVRFTFPIPAVILSVGIVFLTVLIITGSELKRMKGKSLIDTIRIM